MLEKLVIPPDTRFEERNIVVEGDVVIGSNSKLAYGVIARKVIAGEKVSIDGDVIGEEVRLDAWCTVSGNVASKRDAYIGEFASIGGKLTVFGDLEIGRNVRIKNGFEAKGLITIQDPMPVVMFLFLYILILLRLGKLEDIEELFEEVEELESPLVLPENTHIDLDKIISSKDAEVVGSKVIGNLRVRDVYIDGSEIFGSVRGREIIVDGSVVHGTIEGKVVCIANSSGVYGQIRAERVYMEEGCSVEGSIVAREGVWIKEKIELPTATSSEAFQKTELREIEVGLSQTAEESEKSQENEEEKEEKEEIKPENTEGSKGNEESEKEVEEVEKVKDGAAESKPTQVTIQKIEREGASNGVGQEKVQKDVS